MGEESVYTSESEPKSQLRFNQSKIEYYLIGFVIEPGSGSGGYITACGSG